MFLQHLEPLQGALEGYCRRLLHDRSAVKDVLQDAVARAYRDFHKYVEGSSFRAWMFRYVHHEILNSNRRFTRARHQELPSNLAVEETWEMVLDEPLFKILLEDPEQVLDRCDAELAGALRDLDPLEQAVLLLTAIGEFKYREIAEILEVPIGTVMSNLARSRLRLRHRLVSFAVERGLLKPEA